MIALGRVLGALRAGPVGAARLAAWKAWQAGVRHRELGTSHRHYHALSAEFGARWDAEWAGRGVVAWLERAGMGRFFLEPAAARDWCRDTWTPTDAALAQDAVDGRFDLIGSGPRALGVPPRWRTDLYSGAEWPLENAHRMAIVRGDGSDIRTVWELSRGYHVIALARAYWRTGEAQFARTFVGHVDSWIEQNPFGRGPHWASPMDAAIRGANWSLGLLLLGGVPELGATFAGRLLSNLYATAAFVERHREWHPVFRGNHYVANGVGLACMGALFADDRRGRRWQRLGTRIIADELLRQVHPDGVSFEASLGYHRFATQLFGWGAELVRRNAPGRWTPAHEARLAAMYDFIEAYLPESGLAPMIGDNDDGHLHVMDARMLAEPRRHRLGLAALPGGARPAAQAASRLYRDGGFAILRHGRDHCIIRCGPVGLNGAGSHDHNDQLSFELVIDGERVVRDSGTYCYTRDLEERYRFRSTAAHNALQLGGAEQNPIRVEQPWRVLQDRTRSQVVDWSVNTEEIRFVGEHSGYSVQAGSPRVARRIEYSQLDRIWTVSDDVTGTQPLERLEWALHLDCPADLFETGSGRASVRLGSAALRLSFPNNLDCRLVTVPSSDRYGSRSLKAMLRISGPAELPLRITMDVRGLQLPGASLRASAVAHHDHGSGHGAG